MIEVSEAFKLVNENMIDFGTERADLSNLAGHRIAEDILTDREYPPFHRVMMDGIAVSHESYQAGRREFKIQGICPAGEPQKSLTDQDECLEVMTGAPLPNGASLVIPYENTRIENGIASVNDEERAHMQNVHLQGSDNKKGDLVLASGKKLNGPLWGILTSLGVSAPKIKREPRINIISTGDELVAPDETPKAHQIRRSNAYALKASLNAFGYHNVTLSHLDDKREEIEAHFTNSVKENDILIYSGGVSKGKFDFLPSTWEKMGVEKIFHRVSQRPGKPLWFGVDKQNQSVIFGLPGNPVSSLVCLHKYFLQNRPIYARLSEDVVFKKDLTYFLASRVEFNEEGNVLAIPVAIKNSGEFSALAESDGFIELTKDKKVDNVFKAGEVFKFHYWRPL